MTERSLRSPTPRSRQERNRLAGTSVVPPVRWASLGILLLGACRSTAPAGGAAPSAGPSASASAVPSRLDGAAALERVRALPEVVARLKEDPRASAKLDAGPAFVVSVGRGPEDVSEMVFVVDEKSGEIRVDANRHEHFTRDPISLERWRDERIERPKVAARVASLPEVRGFEKGLEKLGLRLALWLDAAPPGRECFAGAAECDWVYYVGEGHPDHSVRLFSVLVNRPTGELSVVGLDAKRVPYDEWKKSKLAASMRAGR